MAQQVQAVLQQVLQQAREAGQSVAQSVLADVDVQPLVRAVKGGLNVDEVHALITNKTLAKYFLIVVVLNTVTILAARQSGRGRSPLYTILATLASVFLAPTLIPILTGNPVAWIQNDQLVLTAVGVAVAGYLGVRWIWGLLPVRLIGAVVLAAASSGVITAGWKTGATAFKSSTGALVIAALDASLRVGAGAVEAYLVDGAAGSLTILRTPIAGAIVFGAVTLATANEKLGQVAAFAVLAIGFVAANLGLPIDWFLPVELLLGGRVSQRVRADPAVEKIKAEAARANQAAQNGSPKKK